MENKLKKKLQAGTKPLGTFLQFGFEMVAEAMTQSGMDYLIIDTEHGPSDVETTSRMIRACGNEITPLVRVKDPSRASILKMLDVGAEGLIIPWLKSPQEVKDIIGFSRYAPQGERGFAMGRRAGFGFKKEAGSISNYFESSNQETLIFPMCERPELLEHLEEVVAMEGVDGIFVGPYDLSVALGMPGQFDQEVFQEALQKILRLTQAYGKWSIIYAGDVARARSFSEMGFDSVTLGIDIPVFISAYRDLVQAFRKA